ncbi:glycosyltransferase family 2 protein [Saccharibacillus sp. JS10]|uniref:glycosyltransferase family 2 protein n=1 Tax=Saccharibacillus sp. JS10 TaxID=2950552 RepID=UPI00210D850D|nr:glycosyltransferase family 2 protein [Saccharibacillus sp. JS10]MCQ4088804.1 glycosyltransferase family 2 protein [Saccharibacillus sp. JS10]
MNLPLISVIIPAYNREQTLKYCLDSVIRQTYTNIEVIVVDDASTDHTAYEINAYLDPRVRSIQLSTNSGAQAARNAGIQNAKGEWIAFQDSDDEWLPDKLMTQLNTAIDTGTSINYCECFIKTRENIEVFGTRGYEKKIYEQLLIQSDTTFPGLLVKKECFEVAGLLDENVPAYQEWDTSINLAKYFEFSYCSTPLFIYHLHEGETISKNTKRGLQGIEYIINKHEKEIEQYVGSIVLYHYSSYLIDEYNKIGESSDVLDKKLYWFLKKQEKKIKNCKKICIFGTSSLGLQITSKLSEDQKATLFFVDNYYTSDLFKGFPVYPLSKIKELNPDIVVLASQGSAMNMLRDLLKLGLTDRAVTSKMFESVM